MRTIDWKSNKPTPTPSVLGSGQKVLIPQLSKRATGGSTPNSWNSERKTSRTIEHWTNRMSQSPKYSAVNNENVPPKQKTAAPLLQQKNNGAMQTIQPRSAWVSPEEVTEKEDIQKEGTSKDQSATPVSSNVNENLSKPSRMAEREIMTVSSCSSTSSAPSKIKDAFMDMRAEDISSLGSLLGSPKPDTAKSMAPQSKVAVVRNKAESTPLLGSSLLSTPVLDTTPSTLLEHASLTDKAKDGHQNEKYVLQSSYNTRTKELERSATRVLARDSTEKSKVLLWKADKLMEQAISVIRSSSRSSFNEDSRRNERNMITSTILELDAIQKAFEKKSSTTSGQDKSPCTATTAYSCRCGELYEYPDPGLYLSQISVDVESPNSDESPLQPFPKRRLDYFNTDNPSALRETRSESKFMKATSATQNSFLPDAIQVKQHTYYDRKNVSPSQKKADSPSLLATLREYNQSQGQSRLQLNADSPSTLLGTLREYNQSREQQAQLKSDSSSLLGTLREYNQIRDQRQGNSLKQMSRDEGSNSLGKGGSFRFSGHDSLSTLSEGSAVDRNSMGANHPGLGPHVVRRAALGGSRRTGSDREKHRREHASSTQRPRSKSTPRSFPVERQEARNKTVRFGGPNGKYVIHEEPEPKSCLATMFSRAEYTKERKDPHQRALQHSELKSCRVLPNNESNLYKNQSKKMVSRGAATSPTSIFNYPALSLQEHYIRVEDTGRETPQ